MLYMAWLWLLYFYFICLARRLGPAGRLVSNRHHQALSSCTVVYLT